MQKKEFRTGGKDLFFFLTKFLQNCDIDVKNVKKGLKKGAWWFTMVSSGRKW